MGSRVDVSYEIIDRRALDHAKASVTSHTPYVARFSLTTLDGFERTVSATHARCGKFTVRVPIPSTRARGEIRVVVVDALGLDVVSRRLRIRPQMARRRSVSPRHRRRDS